jgi:hypothetical protein
VELQLRFDAAWRSASTLKIFDFCRRALQAVLVQSVKPAAPRHATPRRAARVLAFVANTRGCCRVPTPKEEATQWNGPSKDALAGLSGVGIDSSNLEEADRNYGFRTAPERA